MKILTVTPDLAKKLLEGNKVNRPISARTIRNYADMMAEGKWKLNGETIKVTPSGNLLDGQHRLLASLLNDVSFDAYYVEVQDTTAFDTIDVGKRRTGSDILAIEGEKHYNTLAAVLPLLGSYYRQNKLTVMSRRCPNHELKIILEEHPKVREDVAYAGNRKICNVLFSKTSIAFCRYVLSKINEDQAHKFIDDLIYGENLQRGSGALAARNHMMDVKSKGDRGYVENHYIIATIFTAWNAYRKNKSCFKIKINIVEDFPVPI